MHKRFIANIISRIVLIVCCFLFVPLIWAILADPNSTEVKAFIYTILFGSAGALIILKNVKLRASDHDKLNAKDGLAIVGLSWVILSALGALPLYLTNTVPSYTDAYFEIVSGFTTTGATVITEIESLPRGIMFWRSLTHWLGGMGIIVLYLALLPAFGSNAFQLYKAEAPGITVERTEPRITETAKTLWGVYFLLSFLETCLLMFGGMPFYDALCHTFGTMATGGFSTKNTSISAYDPYIQWVIIVFMFLAGCNFMLHYQALKGRLKGYIRNEEFQSYLFVILGSIVVFSLILFFGQYSNAPVRDATFQVVAIITTTGFCTADFDLWPHFLRFALVCLMFIGGCGGSTGGGMKIVRFFLSIKIAFRSVIQTIFPNAVVSVRFNGAACSERILRAVSAYFIIFMFLFFLGAIVLTITDQCDLVTAFSASIASLSNIGPGLAKVGAVQNYAWISLPGKWMLIFLMLAGRLELYSILILFHPATWRK
ncbi:MAG: TrkH family potassium uptake protein [Candidatus Omnitrophica bacterium]|nr:TrkH family potassium uptake protein [Candidatus Omnitrophota bacterium]